MLRTLFLAAAVVAVTFATAADALASRGQHQAMSKNFVTAADANCAALGKLVAPLGNPTTLPAIAHKLSIVIPAFTMALRAQAELITFAMPPGEAALASRWMSAMTSYGRELATIRAAAAARHGGAATKANAKLTTIGGRAASLSKRLGLHVCFQS
jgi:hypothetical protein